MNLIISYYSYHRWHRNIIGPPSSTCCDITCATCFGVLSTQCLTCNGGSYFYATSCLTVCPNKLWPNIIGNTCSVCDPSCATCSVGGSFN